MKKTIDQLFEEYIQQCQYMGKLRPETLRGYRACFRTLQKICPDTSLENLSPTKMTDFFRKLEKRERIVGKGILKTGIKNSTVATYRNKLDRFFKWLRVNKHIQLDPFLGIPYPDVNYSDRKYLSRENVEKIFSAISLNMQWQSTFVKRRNLAIFGVLLNCGLRKGELAGIHLLDVDFDHKELKVRAESSKSKRDRIVPLNSMVTGFLKEYLEERRKRHCTSEYLWVANGGDTKFTANGLKHLFALVLRESGVKFTPHQFRHTFAVNILNSGADIYKLKQLLGHKDIRMTCVYLRCLPTKAMVQDVERITFENLVE